MRRLGKRAAEAKIVTGAAISVAQVPDTLVIAGMTEAKPPIPTDSLIFGYGPMLPFVAAAIGAWALPSPWPEHAVGLAIIWGGLILSFVAGVRRGYGFGNPAASTPREIIAAMVYFVPAGLALLCGIIGNWTAALALLIVGYLLVIVFDRFGAVAGNAPAHFARLRPPQMAIAVVALAALLARVVIHP